MRFGSFGLSRNTVKRLSRKCSSINLLVSIDRYSAHLRFHEQLSARRQVDVLVFAPVSSVSPAVHPPESIVARVEVPGTDYSHFRNSRWNPEPRVCVESAT